MKRKRIYKLISVIKKANDYESPLLQLTEVRIEAVIAASRKVNVNGNMEELWNDENLNAEFDWDA